MEIPSTVAHSDQRLDGSLVFWTWQVGGVGGAGSELWDTYPQS